MFQVYQKVKKYIYYSYIYSEYNIIHIYSEYIIHIYSKYIYYSYICEYIYIIHIYSKYIYYSYIYENNG